MKHNIKINLVMVALFLAAQFTGLYIVNSYIDHKKTEATQIVEWKELPYGFERPEVENQSTSFIPIIIAVIIGTLLFLALVKYRRPFLIKIWFFVTFFLTLSISFNVFVSSFIAGILALVFTAIRMFKNNPVIHNLTEIFIYGGIASIFVPILNMLSAFALLAAISVYDIIAVWKTKHMVKLAEFQTKSKIFAGLFIPYGKENPSKGFFSKREPEDSKSSKRQETQYEIKKSPTAILGGGDIGFPLIFAGVVMKELMLKESLAVGFLKTSIIPVFAALALFILLYKGEKNKYYPAMPFLSAGVILGYVVILII